MKITIQLMLFCTFSICAINCNYLLAQERDEQVELVRQELEFLAVKLMRITGESEFTTTHEGHKMRVFGACGEETDSGISVYCVMLDSTAERMGIEIGDTITKINDVEFSNLEPENARKRYAQVLRGIKEGEKLTVTYSRGTVIQEKTEIYRTFYSPSYTFTVNSVQQEQ